MGQKTCRLCGQSTIVGAFQRFSAMTVVDRQYLERVIDEQLFHASGYFSGDDFISIGNLTNSRYVVFGSVTRAGNSHIVDLAVRISSINGIPAAQASVQRNISIMTQDEFSGMQVAAAEGERLPMAFNQPVRGSSIWAPEHVVIGANVTIQNSFGDGFGRSEFVAFYNNNGRREGIYTFCRSSYTWVFMPPQLEP